MLQNIRKLSPYKQTPPPARPAVELHHATDLIDPSSTQFDSSDSDISLSPNPVQKEGGEPELRYWQRRGDREYAEKGGAGNTKWGQKEKVVQAVRQKVEKSLQQSPPRLRVCVEDLLNPGVPPDKNILRVLRGRARKAALRAGTGEQPSPDRKLRKEVYRIGERQEASKRRKGGAGSGLARLAHFLIDPQIVFQSRHALQEGECERMAEENVRLCQELERLSSVLTEKDLLLLRLHRGAGKEVHRRGAPLWQNEQREKAADILFASTDPHVHGGTSEEAETEVVVQHGTEGAKGRFEVARWKEEKEKARDEETLQTDSVKFQKGKGLDESMGFDRKGADLGVLRESLLCPASASTQCQPLARSREGVVREEGESVQGGTLGEREEKRKEELRGSRTFESQTFDGDRRRIRDDTQRDSHSSGEGRGGRQRHRDRDRDRRRERDRCIGRDIQRETDLYKDGEKHRGRDALRRRDRPTRSRRRKEVATTDEDVASLVHPRDKHRLTPRDFFRSRDPSPASLQSLFSPHSSPRKRQEFCDDRQSSSPLRQSQSDLPVRTEEQRLTKGSKSVRCDSFAVDQARQIPKSPPTCTWTPPEFYDSVWHLLKGGDANPFAFLQ
uniref:Uncharacterized protein n=1 Tax=Chromera velia CCMP2878 TaxID=1169474 RepID=A0A0G4HX75_9ALVE|eukprot:Cvel_9211.t1-p1 / transcript=Cvel_9211.t1 / gene=Cvel_9211 / organism=Chromera_velia_CCMP2878 / gene_product=hypothetical protein / transcript_product=hypothetical protein / location=Cvel_scaffold525:26933-29741(-) / protein_length=613 / sequence_SO=supercontig / SO=protein_coding / is_pseudo=false